MEDQYNVMRLALVLAKQAEIEGMKVENLIRQSNKEAPAYNADAFIQAAEELRVLAYMHNMQL